MATQNYDNRTYQRQKTKTESEEEHFESELKKQFGNNYSGFFKNSDNEEYNMHIERLKSFIQSLLNRNDNITTSQLRNIFSLSKKAKRKEDLYIIRPKLAYAYGRSDKLELKKLLFFLDKQIQNIKDDKDVLSFQELFEAIVAYHKYYGGKD